MAVQQTTFLHHGKSLWSLMGGGHFQESVYKRSVPRRNTENSTIINLQKVEFDRPGERSPERTVVVDSD